MTDQQDVADSSTESDASASTDQETDQTVETKSNGSEADTNTDEGKDKSVPYDRFHEVNEAKKQAEERATKVEQELEDLKKSNEESQNESSSDEIDPDTEKILESYAKRHGLVSKSELQLQSDVQDLKSEYAKSGIPFEDKAIYDYSKNNGLPVPSSKEGWRAMYRALNHESILETERKRAVEAYRSGDKSTAEKPGPGGAKAPTETKLLTRKERIHAAAQKVFGS